MDWDLKINPGVRTPQELNLPNEEPLQWSAWLFVCLFFNPQTWKPLKTTAWFSSDCTISKKLNCSSVWTLRRSSSKHRMIDCAEINYRIVSVSAQLIICLKNKPLTTHGLSSCCVAFSTWTWMCFVFPSVFCILSIPHLYFVVGGQLSVEAALIIAFWRRVLSISRGKWRFNST